MANAYRDNNNIPTLIAALDSDGHTITRVLGNPTNHSMVVNIDPGGSDNGPGSVDLRDSNSVPCLMAVSSVDGVTPVVLYVDSGGGLLIDNT